jgi:pimeloyl-ACP methyl ester carboxylesterase
MTRLITEYQDLGDIQVAYWQYGSGPDLLLLHGNSESKVIFAHHVLEHFTGFHTWALDSRSHGESKSEDESLSIEQIADDVVRFCQAKGIKKAYVVGYSDGGNIALFLAKKAPQLFPKIVAVSPNTLVSGTEDGTLRLFKVIYGVIKFLAKLGFKVKKQVMVIDLMLNDIGLSFDDLKTIQTSVKVLYAEKDLIKEDHIKDIAAAIPGSTLDKIPACTHMNIMESPAAIKIIQDYLGAGK